MALAKLSEVRHGAVFGVVAEPEPDGVVDRDAVELGRIDEPHVGQDLLGHADTHGPLIDEVIKYQADHGNFAKPPAIAAVTSDDESPTAPTKRRSSRTREPKQ